MKENKKLPIEKSVEYYAALGAIKWASNYYDFYRMKRIIKHLVGTSVLDTGCGKADFLNLIKKRYQISGIELNNERVNYCNEILGENAVKVGNLEKKLNFADNSFDTVTCMEVLEHLVNPVQALSELTRISRKRIIFTVPFNQKIQYVICTHCGKLTPTSDHLHSFNEMSIRDIIPANTRIVKMELIGNKALRLIPYLSSIVFKAPLWIASFIDKFLNHIFPKASWMMVILDKNNDSADSH